MNPLLELQDCGQSIWLDCMRRHLITSGELQRLIEEDGLSGITSNPSIFEKALTGSTDYDVFLATEGRQGMDAKALYEDFAIIDIQQAADILRPVYERTQRADGYASLEVSPYLAHDTQGTIQEARRLWKKLGRDNVMIKVPGTPEGVLAIRQLIGEGININVTLLFSQERYTEVAEAFLSGLEDLAAHGGDLSRIASVASFFVSRIDTAADAQINAKLKASPGRGEEAKLRWLLGKIGIANSKLAYKQFKEILKSPRWEALATKGARPQRMLWASTSTKDPTYRDVLYVEELIGPATINTLTPATMDAFRDHGQVRLSLEEGLDDARRVLETLDQVGISLAEITAGRLDEGVQRFSDSFDQLLAAIEKKREGALGPAMDRMTYHVPDFLARGVADVLEEWRREGKVRRLWARDASLWTNHDENRWLDWLGLTEDQRAQGEQFRTIAADVRGAGFTHAVLLGMGGSSLAPEVLARTFGKQEGYPEFLVLDSTDPAQIRAMEDRINLNKTLFIVSSKSGTTLEPNILRDYFFARVREKLGAEQAGRHFIAITDPGSQLEQSAAAAGFRQVFLGVPGVGGRYSALSNFGMVPAAIMGLDVSRLLDSAEIMVHACASCVPPTQNPGVFLGVILGTLANHGRDKITLIASPGISELGAWLEQLLAESTGKYGKGVIPIADEPPGPPEVYGQDRLFVYLRMDKGADTAQDAAVHALQQAGQPVVQIAIADAYDLGQEFFRWEFATAVAGALLGINPFDQPDVEASKIETRKLTAAYEQEAALPPESSLLQEGDIRLFADGRNAGALTQAAGADRSLRGYLKAHINRLQNGDYFALLAYIERNSEHQDQLQEIRWEVRDAKRVATCLGFGPRFLHSTGQAYKGGPNTGVFLQITCDDAHDLPVPGHKFSFGIVKAAQARGDLEVLSQRGRRVLRAHLGPDVAAGLANLYEAMRQALGVDSSQAGG